MSISDKVVAAALAMLWAASAAARADAKVEQQVLGPDGESIGGAISPHGAHVAVLAAKGSRFVVLLDGVEGPKIDALLSSVMGSPFQAATYWMGQVPVLFSDDGAHSAYSAKMGNDYVVMLDGKELARGPFTGNASLNLPLSFSAGGKHLFYMDLDAAGKYHIVVDGKPGPACYIQPQLVVSADGAHYAYVGYERDRANTKWAVVDGRQVNFFGDNLQYTGKGVLVSRMSENGAAVLVLNGKPKLKASRLDPTWMSPDGAEIAIVITANNGDPSVLSVNGKLVPGTEGLMIEQVYFSPDGKRYAALVHTKANAKFMLIDGKKGQEYQDIPHELPQNMQAHWRFTTANDDVTVASMQPSVPGFTPDSSKFVYVAQQGARRFLIVEDQESNGFQSMDMLTLSSNGHRLGVIALAPNGTQHVLVDDKDQVLSSINTPGAMRVNCLTFSPGGVHYAYVYGFNVCLDGVAQPGMINGGSYVFSPDDKHLAYPATIADRGCFVLDGKVVDKNSYMINYAFFSPDSQHLFWVRSGNLQTQGTKDSRMLYVDGKPVTHYGETGGGLPAHFEFSSDGVLTFVARTDESFKRFRVTPSPDEGIAKMLADADAADAIAKAQTEASKGTAKR